MYVWWLKPLDVALKSENETIKTDKITLYMQNVKTAIFAETGTGNLQATIKTSKPQFKWKLLYSPISAFLPCLSPFSVCFAHISCVTLLLLSFAIFWVIELTARNCKCQNRKIQDKKMKGRGYYSGSVVNLFTWCLWHAAYYGWMWPSVFCWFPILIILILCCCWLICN